jgi:hypothetical protein
LLDACGNEQPGFNELEEDFVDEKRAAGMTKVVPDRLGQGD